MTDKRLFVEFRVEFDPSTNQELLNEVAEALRDRMWDILDGCELCDDEVQPTPSAKDITFELVMMVPKIEERLKLGSGRMREIPLREEDRKEEDRNG
jgi:hypothetical protein